MPKVRATNIVFFLVGLGLFAFLVTEFGHDAILANVQRAGWSLAYVVVVWLGIYLLNTAAWSLVLGAQGARIGFGRLFMVTVSGFVINYITPVVALGGEPYKVSALAGTLGAGRSVSAVVLYRMVHLLGHMLLLHTGVLAALVLLPLGSAVNAALWPAPSASPTPQSATDFAAFLDQLGSGNLRFGGETFRGHAMLGPIEVRAEGHAVRVDLAEFGQRHDLKAAAIRQDGAGPVHEFMEAAQRRDPLRRLTLAIHAIGDAGNLASRIESLTKVHDTTILVSEAMAQQTQIARVGPAWEAFLRRFPTVERLADAPVAVPAVDAVEDRPGDG